MKERLTAYLPAARLIWFVEAHLEGSVLPEMSRCAGGTDIGQRMSLLTRHEPAGARRSSRSRRYVENRAAGWLVSRMKRMLRTGGGTVLAIAAVQSLDRE